MWLRQRSPNTTFSHEKFCDRVFFLARIAACEIGAERTLKFEKSIIIFSLCIGDNIAKHSEEQDMPHVNGHALKKFQPETCKTQREIQICVIEWVTPLTGSILY